MRGLAPAPSASWRLQSCACASRRQPRAAATRIAAAPQPSALPPMQQQQHPGAPLVKVCGVTNEADADHAAAAGADFIGMILWSKGRRAVSDATAVAIAAAARRHGAEPIGVFVDEDAPTIAKRCAAAGVRIAQLHGDGARAALPGLPLDLQVVYVLQADDSGSIVTPLPGAPGGPPLSRTVDWLLVDGMTGGSGRTFDWNGLAVPHGVAARGWLLAGGLTPDNVADAVAAAAPGGVDVASGVCGPDGLVKDAARVEAFLRAAKGSATRANANATSTD